VMATKNSFSNFTEQGVLLRGATHTVLDFITITGNTFANTVVAYGTKFSGGATSGKIVVSDNTIA
jgi:hypothetical protein